MHHLNTIPLKFDPKANPNIVATKTTQPIRVEHIAAGLSFWAVGMALAMLVFAGEIAKQKVKKRRNISVEETHAIYE